MTVCRICGADAEHELFKVREMQFGTREEFVYFECSSCKCLQLRDIPDTVQHYPENYYSLHTINPPERPTVNRRARRLGLRKIIDYKLGNRGVLGKMLERKYGYGFIPYWLVKSGLSIFHDSKILDVGCGSGESLMQLESRGFTNLLGIDPFISADITYANGVIIRKASLESINDRFDFIMLHHSLEHMEDPLRVLKKINSLLPQGHYALIRIPIKAYAWEHYGTNWAQIDAPRHLFLHSTESISLLASQAGFEVSEIIFDSSEFQFWASEQYSRDIPLKAANSYDVNPSESIFSEEEIESFKLKALELNQTKRGDQACIYLRKVS